MQILRCDHIHLITQNIGDTVEWYRRVLDAKIIFKGQFKKSDVYYLDVAGMTIIVFGELEHETETHLPSSRLQYGIDHFGFAVDDLEQTINTIKKLGVKVLEGPLTVRKGLRIAYVEGPDNVKIEFCERS